MAGLMLASGAFAPADAAERAAPQADEAEWTRKCTARADRNAMRRNLRRPFIEQCVAGYRINGHRDLQLRKPKF